MAARIQAAQPADAPTVAVLVGELLQEIMATTGGTDFSFDWQEATARAEEMLKRHVYFAFIAWDDAQPAGLACLYESHALYAGGSFGTLSELYVRPAGRSQGIGAALLDEARRFGAARGWQRLEVTTPPLPWFERALGFYERHGFAVTGGRKLKSLL